MTKGCAVIIQIVLHVKKALLLLAPPLSLLLAYEKVATSPRKKSIDISFGLWKIIIKKN